MKIKTEAEKGMKGGRVKAVQVIASTIGAIFGIAGMNHGFFEILQVNKPTNGFIIQAIGEGQRFWELGTEEAFTIIPNFLLSGILSMILGAAIVVWSIWHIQTRHGTRVFFLLFVLLFLCGGGIGQIVFFIPAWAFATRINKPLKWWQKALHPRIRPILSRIWAVILVLSSISMVIGMLIAVFGYIPGITDPEQVRDFAMLLVAISAILNIAAFIAGMGDQLFKTDEALSKIRDF